MMTDEAMMQATRETAAKILSRTPGGCPQWCQGSMHKDGEVAHDGTLGGDPQFQVDLIQYPGERPQVVLWVDGESVSTTAGPWVLIDAARGLLEAADKLDEIDRQAKRDGVESGVTA